MKNGQTSDDPRLARITEFDDRSLEYRIRAELTPEQFAHPRSYSWRTRTALDQGFSGACVGFAWAHELISRPAEVTGVTARFAKEMIYWEAQKRDAYPGGAYPGASPLAFGTSVLAAAKIVRDLGLIGSYHWATNAEELVATLGYKGPVVFGCSWFEGMQNCGRDGLCTPTGRRSGAHCVLLNGVKIVRTANGSVDYDRSIVRFQNSFGRDWGDQGCGKLRLQDLPKLTEGADMCVAVNRRSAQIS
ncbi:MAG: hypothetical protein WBA51_20005 [Erythrobacter sp.]